MSGVKGKYQNFYHCPRCDYAWVDEWDCTCDDDCPECGNRHITPYQAIDLETGVTIK